MEPEMKEKVPENETQKELACDEEIAFDTTTTTICKDASQQESEGSTIPFLEKSTAE
jgi:hypothetical protein